MAQRRTQVQIPERRDDEAPATPAQLKHIRELVAGMSLRGYRFDYRKLGTDQADSIISQLIGLRDSQGPSNEPAKRRSGGGCGVSLTGAFVSLVIVCAAVAGAYTYLLKDLGLAWEDVLDFDNPFASSSETTGEAEPEDAGEGVSEEEGGGETLADGGDGVVSSEENERWVESLLFEGQRVRARDGQDNPPPPINPGTDNPTPPTDDTPDPPTTEPGLSADTVSQLAALEELLVQYSQTTRSERQFDVSVRETIVRGLNSRLDQLPAAMRHLEAQDAELVQRLRAVMQRYAEETLPAEAIRAEITVIRERLDRLGDGS